MATKKGFEINDKVFAKIRGYKFWPARIEQIKDQNYYILFYGGYQRGRVTANNMHYYLRNKLSLVKKSKQKSYLSAIKEIEAEIKFDGTDGDPNPNDSPDTIVMTKQTKKKCVGRPKKSSKKQVKKAITSTISQTNEDNSDAMSLISMRCDSRVSLFSNHYPEFEDDDDASGCEYIDVQMVPSYYFMAKVIYFHNVCKNIELYKNRPPEEFQEDQENVLRVLIVQLPNKEYIGLKYETKTKLDFQNEFERAEFDKNISEILLDLKTKLERGICTDINNEFTIPNIKFNEDAYKNIDTYFLQNYVNAKLEISENLLECIDGLHKGIILDDLNLILGYLEKSRNYLKNDFFLSKDPRMLYICVGIFTSHKFCIDDSVLCKILMTTYEVFNTIKDTFNCFYKSNEEFLSIYIEKHNHYKRTTEKLNMEQRRALIAQPNSRAQLMYEIYCNEIQHKIL